MLHCVQLANVVTSQGNGWYEDVPCCVASLSKRVYLYVDGNKEDEEELMAPMLPASSGFNSRGGALDFDSLLQQAQRSISKRGK
jgi:hypothetical protein